MTRRPNHKRCFQLESLETRQLLSTVAAPSPEQQYALELINQLRTQPAAAADRLTTKLSASTLDTLDAYGVDLAAEKRAIASAEARQPLAWNEKLAAAAEEHSRDMAEKGFQDHNGSDGSTAEVRIRRNGYKPRRNAENAFAYGESIDQATQAFAIDWGVSTKGHRKNIQEPDNRDDSFKEVGIGIVRSRKTGFGLVVTQNLGLEDDTPSHLLGVAYKDRDGDNFYSIGEGQGGVTIEVTGNGQTQRVQTSAAGGYQIPLNAGRYKVRALLGDRELMSRDVQVGNQNVKVDVVVDNAASTTTTTVATTPARSTARPATTVAVTNATSSAVSVRAAVPSNAANTLSNLNATPAVVPTGPASAVTRQSGLSWNTWRAIPRG